MCVREREFIENVAYKVIKSRHTQDDTLLVATFSIYTRKLLWVKTFANILRTVATICESFPRISHIRVEYSFRVTHERFLAKFLPIRKGFHPQKFPALYTVYNTSWLGLSR